MKRLLAYTLFLPLGWLVGCGDPDLGDDSDQTWATGGSSASGGSISSVGGTSTASGGATASSGGAAAAGGAVGAGGLSGTGGTTSSSCSYAVWSVGQSYAVGAIVQYPGTQNFYEAVNATEPGIDPTISTWYWQPYTCNAPASGGATSGGGGTTSSSGGTTGGSGGAASTAFSTLLPESVFNQMFSNNDRDPVFSYAGLVAAAADFPAFAGSGDTETKKREIAAFLANVAQETGFLRYSREIARGNYCQSSGDCPCSDGSSTDYYGRGAIQLSWNYNYCAANLALTALGYDLHANPDLVATNAELAWVTGLWYWMSRKGGTAYTSHEAIVDSHGFGATINAINGALECGGNWSSHAGPTRVSNYQTFCALLGVSPGSALTC